MYYLRSEEISQLIGAYSHKWYERLSKEGFWPDPDEIQSGVGYAIAKSLLHFNTSHRSGAKFITYTVRAITNIMINYRRRLKKDECLIPLEYLNDEEQHGHWFTEWEN